MQTRAGWRNHYDALNGWRSAVEALGVLVVQLRNVPIEEMRGCSLALFPLPVIILNSADSPLGRVFTLLHELTHLARAESGLCDLAEEVPRRKADEVVEAYCNRVAGIGPAPKPSCGACSTPAKRPASFTAYGACSGSANWQKAKRRAAPCRITASCC